MSWSDIVRKLTSRKFWMAVASFVTLIYIACGHTETEAGEIASIIMAGASVLAYIVGEGLIDASRTDVYEEDDSDVT